MPRLSPPPFSDCHFSADATPRYCRAYDAAPLIADTILPRYAALFYRRRDAARRYYSWRVCRRALLRQRRCCRYARRRGYMRSGYARYARGIKMRLR